MPQTYQVNLAGFCQLTGVIMRPYMVETEPAYSKSKYLLNNKFVTLAVYHMRPGGTEPKHYHKGIEFVYVLDGNCETH